MSDIYSRHFTKRRAHKVATAATLASRNVGRSSGWARIDYRVRKVGGLRRWAVVRT
jgi:hypothetical protein